MLWIVFLAYLWETAQVNMKSEMSQSPLRRTCMLADAWVNIADGLYVFDLHQGLIYTISWILLAIDSFYLHLAAFLVYL